MKYNILKWHDPKYFLPQKERVLLIQYWEYGGVSYKLGIFDKKTFYECVFALGAIPKPLYRKKILRWSYLPEVK